MLYWDFFSGFHVGQKLTRKVRESSINTSFILVNLSVRLYQSVGWFSLSHTFTLPAMVDLTSVHF